MDLKTKNLGTFKHESDQNRVWGNLYFVDNFDGKLQLQETEVESIHLWTASDIEFNINLVEMGSANDCKITPDSIEAYKEFIKRVN